MAAALLGGAACFAQGPAEGLDQTVDYLIDYVEASDYTFIRNGEAHSSGEASKHIRAKYRQFRERIETPEDFIRLAASKSLTTGRPYYIERPDGKRIRSAVWLRKVLRDYRESRNGPQQ